MSNNQLRDMILFKISTRVKSDEWFTNRYFWIAEWVYDKYVVSEPNITNKTKYKKVRQFNIMGHVVKLNDLDLMRVFEMVIRSMYTCM